MASGLQVWNAQGQLTLDTSDRLMRVLERRVVSGTGSTSHSGLSTGEPFWFLCPNSSGYGMFPETQITVSGNTISWDIRRFTEDDIVSGSGILIYGVY